MLPGGQYATGQAPGRSEVIVSSLRWRLILYCQGQLFCFVGFLSARGQTRRVCIVRRGSSLSWLSIRIGLQGRKPRESNKLFDLFFPSHDLSVVKEKCSLRGHIHHFGVNCSLGVSLTLWYYLCFFGKKEGFTDIAISFCLFPLILYTEKYAQLLAGILARLAHR